MALDTFEELSFRLHSVIYCFMWKYPMKWNSDYTFLCFIPRSAKLNWVLTGVAAFLLWLFGALCVFVIIFDLFLKPSPQFSFINALILFMAAIFCWSYVFLVVLGHRYGEGLVAAFNEVLKFIDEIDQGYPCKWRTGQRMQNSSLRVLLPFVLILGPFFIPFISGFGCLISNVDLPFFLLEKVLSNPTQRSRRAIYFSLLLRFCMNFAACLEISRLLSFLACVFYVAVTRITLFTNLMLHRLSEFGDFHYYYTCARLLFTKCQKVIHVGLYFVMDIAFWSNVLCIWVTIRCSPESLSPPIYVAFSVAAVALVFVHYIVIPMIGQAAHLAIIVVYLNRFKCKFVYSRKKSVGGKVNLLNAQAIAPIQVKYGAFWNINKKFVGEYLWLIVCRSFDAILVLAD